MKSVSAGRPDLRGSAERRFSPLVRTSFLVSLLALGLVAVGCCYFAVAGSRMAFLRGATLRLDAADDVYRLMPVPEATAEPFDVVAAIPAPDMDTAWWSPVAMVNPDALAEYTLRAGGGNCAAKSRGLGWWLWSRGIPFRLVFLMKDPEVRDGDAHTMVETCWRWSGVPVVALLDPLASGVPLVDGRPLDSDRLLAGRSGLLVEYVPERPDLDALKLRPRWVFAEGSVREESFVSYSPGEEVIRHERLMGLLGRFVPDSAISRMAGMTLSLFLGTYPLNYVPATESDRVSGILRTDMWMARGMIWGARAFCVAGLVFLLAWMLDRRWSRQKLAAAVGNPGSFG